MNWQYTGRLLPLDVPINIPARDGQPRFSYTFDHQTFAGEKGSKRVIDVCDDHNRLKVIGKVDRLIAQLGFWECEFQLDPGQDELQLGQPVSVGLQTIGVCGDTPFLTEVSVVPRGAIEGALVRNRRLLPQPAKPEPPKPTVASTPTRAPVAAPPVLNRTSQAERHAIEMAELRRRHDWLLDNGYHADLEDIVANLKDELGYGRDISREWRRLRTTA